MNEPLLTFKSHIEGKNADVAVYSDRIEWTKQGMGAFGKSALGLATGGVSLLKTGIKGRAKGAEMMPMKSVSSITTEKDGLRFTKVRVIASGNTIDFRVGHDEAGRIKDLLTQLILGNHPTQAAPRPTPAPASQPPTPQEPDVMEQLKKLAELKDAGVLTPEEFDTKKTELLKRV